MKNACLGAAAAVLILGGLAFAVAYRREVVADRPMSGPERAVSGFVFERALSRAPEVQNPLGGPSRAGLARYDQLCRACHGAPGGPLGALGGGLNPPPPDLSREQTQRRTDGQLYFVLRHGVRHTGMPAFGATRSERELWELVSFLRYLPHLSPEDRLLLGDGAAR